MNQGSICVVTRDVSIDNTLVFKTGDRLVVELIHPNPERPDYKYVVTSPHSGTKYQLSDAEVAPEDVSRIQSPESDSRPSRRWRSIVVSAVVLLVLVLAAGAVYFIFFKTKTVPGVIGLSKPAAEQTIASAGYKASCTCKYPHPIGTEKVVWQTPKQGTRDKKVDTVKIVISDLAMESAVNQAQQAVGQANGVLHELQAMGIDTADLAGPIQNAQAKLDAAHSVADCVGQTDSASYWAGTVINSCNAKKQAFMVQQERSRQIANCQSAMLSYARANSASGMSIGFSSFSMNSDCTAASAMLHGSLNGQTLESVKITAIRRGDSWVVTDFGTGIY